MRRTLPKVLIALSLTGIGAGIGGSPAAATGADMAILDTTVTIEPLGLDPLQLSMDDVVDSPCDTTGAHPTAIVAASGSSGAWDTEATGASFPERIPFELAGDDYGLDLSLYTGLGADNTGVVSGMASPYTMSQNIALHGQIGDIDPLTCAMDDVDCEVYILLPLSGTYDGDVDAGALTGSADLDGSGSVFTGSCDAPLTSLDGAAVTALLTISAIAPISVEWDGLNLGTGTVCNFSVTRYGGGTMVPNEPVPRDTVEVIAHGAVGRAYSVTLKLCTKPGGYTFDITDGDCDPGSPLTGQTEPSMTIVTSPDEDGAHCAFTVVVLPPPP